MRDFHDNQRNWLLWMAVLTTALAVVLLLSLGLRRLSHHLWSRVGSGGG